VTKALNLPAVLDALEKPISLPPSLLAKAREIRGHDAPSLIERYLEAIEELSSQNSNTLDEVIQLAFFLEQNVSRQVVGDRNPR
jgi:programmed cell death 6-interacting protein